MDKTNYSLEDECCPMDVDDPVLDSTFKIDDSCQWDISMQDLGNTCETISSTQPSFAQIENQDHNLPDIINIRNPFVQDVAMPEISHTPQPPNTWNGLTNQNVNLPPKQITNGNFDVAQIAVLNFDIQNNAITNGNIIQEIANDCLGVQMTSSNQFIDSLTVSEDTINLKEMGDSIVSESLQTDSLVVSTDSILNTVSTDSLEIPVACLQIVASANETNTNVREINSEADECLKSKPVLANDKLVNCNTSVESTSDSFVNVEKSDVSTTGETSQISNDVELNEETLSTPSTVISTLQTVVDKSSDLLAAEKKICILEKILVDDVLNATNRISNSKGCDLKALEVSETLVKEKPTRSLESCKIMKSLEAEKIVDNVMDLSYKIALEPALGESCNILESELTTELAIVASGVTIATPKKLIVESAKLNAIPVPSTAGASSLLNSSSQLISVEDCTTMVLKLTEAINETEKNVEIIAVDLKEPVLSNVSEAPNALSVSPSKIEIVKQITDSGLSNNENLKFVTAEVVPVKSNNILSSPVKLFDILGANSLDSSTLGNKTISEQNAKDSEIKSHLINSVEVDVSPKNLLDVIPIVPSSNEATESPKVHESSLINDQVSAEIINIKTCNESNNQAIAPSSGDPKSKPKFAHTKSSPEFSQPPPDISKENFNTLNVAGPVDVSKTICSESSALEPGKSPTGELQNPIQQVSKSPGGKTIPLNFDQLSGRIFLDSPKPIGNPELARRSSTSEYAVAPDFDEKEQKVAMIRGSFSELEQVESEKNRISNVGIQEGNVFNSTGVLTCDLNSTNTIVSDNVNAEENVLNVTSTLVTESGCPINAMDENVLNTTNTLISVNLNTTQIKDDSLLNTTRDNVFNPTNTVTKDKFNTTGEGVLSSNNATITLNSTSVNENVSSTSLTENVNGCLLDITNTIPENGNILESVLTTDNIASVEDMLNITKTCITENANTTIDIVSDKNDLNNTINSEECLHNTTNTPNSVLNVTNDKNSECLNSTTNLTNTQAKILDTEDVFNESNSDRGLNVSKNNSGTSFSESNVTAESTFNSTVILCNEKLNSTQVIDTQPEQSKRRSTQCYISGLVGAVVETALDDSDLKIEKSVDEGLFLNKTGGQLQLDKSFNGKDRLNKSQVTVNSPVKPVPCKILPNDEANVSFEIISSPKRIDLPPVHKVISPDIAKLKLSDNLKKSPKPKDSVGQLKLHPDKVNSSSRLSCSPKITLKSVCRKSDKFVSSNMDLPPYKDTPLDDTVELSNAQLMSSTKVFEDSFNAVCANNNPEDQDGLVCDSLKSQKSVIVKDSQLGAVEDRSPFKKINSNSKDSKVKKVEEGIMPDVVMKVEDVKEPNISYENKENFNLSIFSNSPAKPKPTNRRDTLFRLFDPLYESSTQDTTQTSTSSLQPAEKSETVSNQVSSRLISINEGPDAADIALISCNQIKEDLSDERDIETFLKALPETLHSFKAKMEDAIDEKMKMEQELNELKLELNQLQQERTSLQLELHQKEEVILKIQGEAQKIGNQYKQEIKQLQDKLNTINEQNNNEEVKILREEITKLKDREVQLNEKNSKLVDQITALENTVHNYETTLDRVIKESEKLRVEHDNTKKHLATLEVSFSDVHAKYERTKEFVVAYKNNEEVLSDKLEKSEEIARRYEERYETLKAHAKAQIDKANKELSTMKEKHQIELNKMTAILRRLEIKTGSIQQALDQKTKECAALAALCDEMAGSVPQ